MGFTVDLIFEDYGFTLTHGERKFKLNVYDIKTIFHAMRNTKFVTKMLYIILCISPHRGAFSLQG